MHIEVKIINAQKASHKTKPYNFFALKCQEPKAAYARPAGAFVADVFSEQKSNVWETSTKIKRNLHINHQSQAQRTGGCVTLEFADDSLSTLSQQHRLEAIEE